MKTNSQFVLNNFSKAQQQLFWELSLGKRYCDWISTNTTKI